MASDVTYECVSISEIDWNMICDLKVSVPSCPLKDLKTISTGYLFMYVSKQ